MESNSLIFIGIAALVIIIAGVVTALAVSRKKVKSICLNCGAPLRPGAGFCENCGKRI